jgi:hypothetical protein
VSWSNEFTTNAASWPDTADGATFVGVIAAFASAGALICLKAMNSSPINIYINCPLLPTICQKMVNILSTLLFIIKILLIKLRDYIIYSI